MNASPLRILIVEDNTTTREALKLMMERQGRDVRVTGDGPAALVAAASFRPDVVLLDLGLPGMAGYEVASSLRKTPGLEHVRIVAVTGYGQPLHQVVSQQAGIDAHLVKPVDPADLERALSSSPSATSTP